jgi:hypothetical protein
VKQVGDERGSVTIYLLLAMTAFILLSAVLIDFLRMRMAELQAERAVKAGLRSVMSAFDRELGTYGLFGLTLSDDEQQGIYHQVIDEHVMQDDPSSFQLVRLERTDESHIRSIYSLANATIFERQILESMKYAAPIELATEITGKFRKLKDSFKLAHSFIESASELEKLIQKREEQLERANEEISELGKGMKRGDEEVDQAVKKVNSLLQRIGSTTEEQVSQTIRGLEQSIAASAQSGAPPSPVLFIILSEQYRLLSDLQSYPSAMDQVKSMAQVQEQAYTRGRERLFNAWEETRQIDQQIAVIVSGSTFEVGEDAQQQIRSVPVYGDSYFDNHRSAIEEIEALLQRSVEQMRGLPLDRVPIYYDRNYMDRFDAYANTAEQEAEQRRSSRAEIHRQQREARRTAEAEKKKAEKEAAQSCGNPDDEYYRRLLQPGGLNSKYEAFHRADQRPVSSFDDETAEQATRHMMTFILRGIDALAEIRDDVYVGEYAIAYFNYRTQALDAANTAASNDTWHKARKLEGQEIEYILYGLGSCDGNMAAAYGEMYAIRLAVRTVEALMEPANRAIATGSPWLYVLTAIAQGAGEAYLDMSRMTQGKTIDLTEKLSTVQVNYRDHLRLFLYLHPGSSNRMIRMQSLITLNTGKDLTLTTAYTHANSTFTIKLPTRGGSYPVAVSADYAY